MFVTQPNAIIGQLSIVRYALKATNSPSVMRPQDHFAAAVPQHDHRAQAEEQRHAREEQALQHDQPPGSAAGTPGLHAGIASSSAASWR